ncbi:hypothetical protein E2C01_063145 [Portunus trituberculatus]|uniref:Uncharacterized protein n=1 Tax=Portunus trituberculatus TaxID=210409 RepID=A0A5B7HK08_PORTR|nr:hypothetical protein [Portunus trituberculatus]
MAPVGHVTPSDQSDTRSSETFLAKLSKYKSLTPAIVILPPILAFCLLMEKNIWSKDALATLGDLYR